MSPTCEAVRQCMPPKISFLHPPIVREILTAPSRPGALILGVHSITRVRRMLGKIGRENDFIPLTPNDCSVNPLRDFDRDSRLVMEWIIAHGAHPSPYALTSRLLLAACIVAKMTSVGHIESIHSISEAVSILLELNKSIGTRNKTATLEEAMASFRSAAEQGVIEAWEENAVQQFVGAGVRFVPHTRFFEAVHGVHALLGPLVEGDSAQLFTTGAKPEFQFEELMDKGKIAVADRLLTAGIVDILEEGFMRCFSTRRERIFFDGKATRSINRKRPVFLFRAS